MRTIKNFFFRKVFPLFPVQLKFRAGDFLLRLNGLEIKEAKTQEELKQVYRLRWEIYTEEDFIDPNDYPTQQLTDKYDQYAVSFLAIKRGVPIGTVRVISNSLNGFPAKNVFNILSFPYPLNEVDEISKLSVKKDFRDYLISFGLLKVAFRYSRKRGKKYWLFGTTQKLKDHFERMLMIKLQSLPIGEPGSKEFAERGIGGKKYFQRFELQPFIVELEKLK